MSRRVWRTVVGILLCCRVTPAGGQAIEARMGRFFDSTHWATYRVGVDRPLTGVLGIQLHGDFLRPADGADGGFAGLGTDLTAFRNRDGGPYGVIGLSAGFGSERSNSFSTAWGSWSAGLGYDVLPASFISLGAEGRWRELSLGSRSGLELALGLTLHLGGGPSPPPPSRPVAPSTPDTPINGGGSEETPPGRSRLEPTSLADSIIASATDAMGRPYQFGGTGEDGSGFDCSGLIQFAFRQHGIQLPRRSVDQARKGKKVDRRVSRLQPADLLTFSNRGGPVTHVGLYIGGGEFIHSATRGVQVSTLSPDDPYGRWWYQRWVGVRRIVREAD